jgi:hypothetical protein
MLKTAAANSWQGSSEITGVFFALKKKLTPKLNFG